MLYEADAREIPLPDGSVHCVVTSPPYWGLRDYGLGAWEGGDPECGHEVRKRSGKSCMKVGNAATQKIVSTETGRAEGSGTCSCGARQQAAGIGLEATLAEHLDNVVAVFRELRRVLRDDGTVWLNYGDAYAGGGKSSATPRDRPELGNGGLSSWSNRDATVGIATDIPAKNLMGLPWRVAFALQDDGWWLRSAIVWHKPNPMPESVRDRPTNAYEMIFLLTKRPTYYYDAEAIRTEPPPETKQLSYDTMDFSRRDNGMPRKTDKQRGHTRRHAGFNDRWDAMPKSEQQANGANARNVWTIPTQGRPDAHFATFPDELPRRCILAGTSERGVCAECGAPWERVVDVSYESAGNAPHNASGTGQDPSSGWTGFPRLSKSTNTTGWRPTCDHGGDPIPATVLDPFVGSGTTVAVAQALGRRGIGLDLNPEYLDIAKRRIGAVPLPMF